MLLLWLLVSVSLRPAHGYTNPTDFPDVSLGSVCTCQPPPMPFTLSFHGNAQTSARPFEVTTSAATYQPGDTVTVTISATSPVEFIGFHMHACEEGSNRIIGTFSLVSGGSGFLQCPGLTQNAAVIQNTNVARSSVSHNWIAPLSPSLGNIVFRTTFVQNFPTFWLDANSARITRQVATTATTTVPTTTSTIIPTIITATANHASASSTANRTTTTTVTTTASTNTTTTAAPPIIAPTFIATAATTTYTATPTPTTTTATPTTTASTNTTTTAAPTTTASPTTATPTTTPTTTASPITATSTLTTTTTTTTNTESTTALDISILDFSFSSAEAGCCSPESINCSFFRITNQSTGITAMLSAPISPRRDACLVIVTSVLDSAMLNESLLVYNVTNKTQRTLYNGTTFINKNVVVGIETEPKLNLTTNVLKINLKINATVVSSVLEQNIDFVKQVNNSTGVSLSLAEGSMFNGECSGPLAITPLTRCTASGALLSHARAVSTGSPIAQLLFFTLTSLFIARSP